MKNIDQIRNERRALIKESEGPFWTRWKGQQGRNIKIGELEKKLAALAEQRLAAERRCLRAIGSHARAERAYQQACGEQKQTIAREKAVAGEELAEIFRARRLLALWPSVAYCGPRFVQAMGEKIEKKRRGLRNPWATNIWGLPLAGPGG